MSTRIFHWLTAPAKRPWLTACIVLAALVCGLFLYAELHVREVSAATYWSYACGVELAGYEGGRRSYPARLHPKGGNAYGYTVFSEHDNFEYAAQAEKVEQRAAAAIALLQAPITTSRDRPCQLAPRCDIWLEMKNAQRLKCLGYLDAARGDVPAFLRNLTAGGGP